MFHNANKWCSFLKPSVGKKKIKQERRINNNNFKLIWTKIFHYWLHCFALFAQVAVKDNTGTVVTVILYPFWSLILSAFWKQFKVHSDMEKQLPLWENKTKYVKNTQPSPRISSFSTDRYNKEQSLQMLRHNYLWE